jgi:hypothetical protein
MTKQKDRQRQRPVRFAVRNIQAVTVRLASSGSFASLRMTARTGSDKTNTGFFPFGFAQGQNDNFYGPGERTFGASLSWLIHTAFLHLRHNRGQ